MTTSTTDPFPADLPTAVEPRGAARIRWCPGDPPRLAVSGDVDVVSERWFEAMIADACSRHDRFILDLTELGFISSRGIGSLFRYCPQMSAIVVTEATLIARALDYSGFMQRTPVIHRSAGADLVTCGDVR